MAAATATLELVDISYAKSIVFLFEDEPTKLAATQFWGSNISLGTENTLAST